MGTSSTKSGVNRKRQTSRGVTTGVAAGALGLEIPERTWRIAAIAIFCLAAVLRIYDLNLVPLHHDEGVNGNFLLTLVRDGKYHYDPANYHGPTLYYITAAIPWIIKLFAGASARDIYGLNTVVIRLVPALFGLATIVLVFMLRSRLGAIATLVAALLIAISPGAVYLSRYFIHETLFVFFTLGTVIAALRFYERRNPTYLILAAVSAAMMFATKETAMISAVVLLIALAITIVYPRLIGVDTGSSSLNVVEEEPFLAAVGGPVQFVVWSVVAIAIFVALNVVFYSSFFSNYPQGVYDSLKTFDFWAKTGKAAHVHPPQTYLVWLTKQESASLFLGVVGAIFVVFKPKNRFALFSALWAFGLIAAYSLVPYKTPWLALNFIPPLALTAGHAVQKIYELERAKRTVPLAIVVVACIIGLYQAIDLNFFNYDNDDIYYVYVYAHTKRGTTQLVHEIDRIAQGAEQNSTGITIVSKEYWPLPWYLRNYSRVGYYGHMTSTTEPIIVASEEQRAEVESNFGDAYRQVASAEPGGVFPLRPGVNLLLYARRANSNQ